VVERATSRGHVVHRLAPRGAYGRLLVLVLLCVLVPLATPDDATGAAASLLVQGITVGAAASIAGAVTRIRRVATGTEVLAILLGVVTLTVGGVVSEELVVDLAVVVSLLLAAGVPVLIARDHVRLTTVTLSTVAAGLSVYLLLGLAFAFAHVTLDAFVPGSYSVDLTQSDAIYLSFITLTTVGFGDLTPVTDVARTLVIGEAIIGQLYLVSVIALLVGNLGRRRGGGEVRTPPV
jgi:hypothetical protein